MTVETTSIRLSSESTYRSQSAFYYPVCGLHFILSPCFILTRLWLLILLQFQKISSIYGKVNFPCNLKVAKLKVTPNTMESFLLIVTTSSNSYIHVFIH